MGVYVKGMTTPLGWPRSCEYCTFKDRDWPGYCEVLEHPVKWKDACPLVPVKTPHGRLIDADALVNTVYYTNISESVKEFIADLIEIVPTVIDEEAKDER